MIQALAPDRTEEPFAYGIGVRRANGCFENLDVGSGGNCGEVSGLFAVVVSDQIFGSFAKGYRLPQLLSDPAIGWGNSDANMNHAS
jgi:hypothetical protein